MDRKIYLKINSVINKIYLQQQIKSLPALRIKNFLLMEAELCEYSAELKDLKSTLCRMHLSL